MDICHDYDPAFDTSYCDCVLDSFGFGGGRGLLVDRRVGAVLFCGRLGVDFHFGRHVCDEDAVVRFRWFKMRKEGSELGEEYKTVI